MRASNVLMLIAILCVAWLTGAACAPPSTPSAQIAKEAAFCISKRTAKQLECVDLYPTRQEIDACRAGVQRAYDCLDGDAGSLVTGGE
jgi:hypothetical protein